MFDEYYDELDDIAFNANSSIYINIENRFLEKFNLFNLNEPERFDYYYFLGLVNFIGDLNLKKAINCFEKASECVNKEVVVNYYLSYVYYLDEKYEQSLNVIELVNPILFQEISQQWRYIKMLELKTACLINQSGIENNNEDLIFQAFNSWKTEFNISIKTDDYDYPAEIFHSAFILMKINSSSEIFSKIYRYLNTLIKKFELENQYPFLNQIFNQKFN